ncbi:site-specific integrase [Thermosynechococcaceae cyanobacterium BACA0444]|uniref:Site-specific integrase n=1 Tax=Pseudocalidococcus azoricus BACA0444 TaxID=2918990 RepID=A0AAE4FTT8_9CYAN|nr:site-specific integrase [Pseudocalidococcus azoricus]MDS3861457.1 site-specific integrase [Pseudocalidococcus azoricus BACA0444]
MPRNPSQQVSFTTELAQVNTRLKVARLGLQLEQRGQKLNLRGIFPPKPDSHRLVPHQQRLSLGLPATPPGLEMAERKAMEIALLLIQGRFDWQPYLSPIKHLGPDATVADQVFAFQAHFFNQPPTLGQRSTWSTAYRPYFRKLEALAATRKNISLVELIYATIQSTPANSRSRQACCTAMQALSQFLEIKLPLPLANFAGHYSPTRTQRRQLPSDTEILHYYKQIPNPAWRFVYGIMATYGLRNHEVFFCDYSGLRDQEPEAVIEVLDTTKTGGHQVWPFLPEWVETLKLYDINLPTVNTDLRTTTLQRIGQRVTQQFSRYQIPFSPYDLRHAWAVRTIHIGLPDTVSARMMGHSVAIHTRTYHRWITRRDQQQAVTAARQRWGVLQGN